MPNIKTRLANLLDYSTNTIVILHEQSAGSVVTNPPVIR
jgi:hypothetical protein